MKNPCRELRNLLGVNQVEFGRLIERSFQSIRAYEKHPEDTPADVIHRIISLAAETGHADWAVVLKSDDWRVNAVLYPGETLISAPKPHAPAAATVHPDHASLHAELDEILDSGDPDAIQAVIPNLHLFAKWVRAKGGKRIPAKKRRA